MKLIRYRGGIVSFKLPSDWKEEYYDDGGAAFYKDDEESGTLRLSVLSFESKVKQDNGINLSSKSGMYVEEGFPLKEEVKYTQEDGDELLMYFWDITIPTNNNGQNIVVFSYTVLASQENDIQILQEIDLVRNSILSAHYHSIKDND